MNKSTSSLITPPADRTLTTTRVFDAPRELVYRAWTDPKQFARWFPPDHFTAPVCDLDVRPGGSLRVDMKGDHDAGDFAGAVFPALVERQEPRLLALELGAEADLLIVHREVGDAAAELEQQLARITVALVLFYRVFNRLFGKTVLQLECGDRQPINEET